MEMKIFFGWTVLMVALWAAMFLKLEILVQYLMNVSYTGYASLHGSRHGAVDRD